MEWIDRLNSAINYIEEHLTSKVDYDKLAGIACCSAFHFQRMFGYMAGIPLGGYIRRRRMSLAAVDLQAGEKVIDVALKYGYESPTAFSRAFQSVHGITPSQAKGGGVSLTACPPISFKLSIKGEVELNYRVEKKEAFRIVGVSAQLKSDMGENFKAVPALWEKAAADGTVAKLAGMIGREPMGILGVSACNQKDNWRYYIAVASDNAVEGWEELTIPAATWAIFPGEGRMPNVIQEMEKRIITEWLPSSGYEYGNAPDIEVYLDNDPQTQKFEVWVPVIKKR